MTLRDLKTGEILKECYLDTYADIVQVCQYDSELSEFILLDEFKTLKEFLNNYEEYQYC